MCLLYPLPATISHFLFLLLLRCCNADRFCGAGSVLRSSFHRSCFHRFWILFSAVVSSLCCALFFCCWRLLTLLLAESVLPVFVKGHSDYFLLSLCFSFWSVSLLSCVLSCCSHCWLLLFCCHHICWCDRLKGCRCFCLLHAILLSVSVHDSSCRLMITDSDWWQWQRLAARVGCEFEGVVHVPVLFLVPSLWF